MVSKAVKLLVSLLVCQCVIEPLTCQLLVPGTFFVVQSGELESPSTDETSLQQEFFECGKNSKCSNVVMSASDPKAEKTEDRVQKEIAKSGKRVWWKKINQGTYNLFYLTFSNIGM